MYSSPFWKISGLQTVSIFPTKQETARGSVQPFIASPPFLTKYFLVHHILSKNGMTLESLSRAVRRTAREHFTSVFAKYATAPPTSTKTTACYQFLVTFEQFLRIATMYPHMIFTRNITMVTKELNTTKG
jgi:hypothetical protein